MSISELLEAIDRDKATFPARFHEGGSLGVLRKDLLQVKMRPTDVRRGDRAMYCVDILYWSLPARCVYYLVVRYRLRVEFIHSLNGDLMPSIYCEA